MTSLQSNLRFNPDQSKILNLTLTIRILKNRAVPITTTFGFAWSLGLPPLKAVSRRVAILRGISNTQTQNTKQMPLLAITLTTPCCYHHYHKLNHRISASLRAMVTATSSRNAGAFTTIKEKVTFEREIKKSKFIAIAGPISDEQSAFSFLSLVFLPFPFHLPSRTEALNLNN